MSVVRISQVIGTTRAWKVTGKSGGQAVTGKFAPGDAVACSVWRGDSQASILSPTATWVDANVCTIKVLITAAQVDAAAITPGVYSLLVTATPASDGQPRAIFKGEIRFEADPGTEAAVTSWASYQDLLNWSSQVATVQSSDEDLTQFARQRNYAMTEHVALVVRRYAPVLGGSFRYVSVDGTAAGPYLRRSGSPDGSPPPTRAQVRSWLLEPGRIILNEDVIEANALLAASMVYSGQPGAGSAYTQLSEREYSRAMRAMDRAFVEIDTQNSPNGTPIIRVHRDITYLT